MLRGSSLGIGTWDEQGMVGTKEKALQGCNKMDRKATRVKKGLGPACNSVVHGEEEIS